MRRHKATTLAIVTALILAGCTSAPPPPSPTPPVSPQDSPPAVGAKCSYQSAGEAAKPVELPAAEAPVDGRLNVTLTLEAGAVKMIFDRSKAPCAVNSFESLAKQGYFDDTNCHRLVPGFVLQCGDPTETGRGGPGYKFADELTGAETYARGTVAMANSGPDTNSSQFFIVLDDAGLPPQYVVLGKVEAGSMAVVDSIAAAGAGPNDFPKWGAHIDTVTAE